MFFRIYVLLILASFITLFTKCWIVGAGGIFFTCILWPISISQKYKAWKINGNHLDKTLCFGIKSMRLQTQHFKIIDFVFTKNSFWNSSLKRWSIVTDDRHVRYNYNGVSLSRKHGYSTDTSYNISECTHSYDHTMQSLNREYTCSPSFSHLDHNIYNNSRRDY